MIPSFKQNYPMSLLPSLGRDDNIRDPAGLLADRSREGHARRELEVL